MIDIRGRILHAIRPILQIQVHGDAFAAGIFHLAADVLDMLIGGLLELLGAMLQRAFRQQVQRLTSTFGNPVHTLAVIHEAEHLYPIQLVDLLCITADHLYGLFLAVGDTGRSHLDTVHIQIVQQHTGHHEFLMRQEGYTTGLLAVAQGGIQDFHKGLDTLVTVYFLCCSHVMVLSWFCTKKSISSRPFIRQCFL